MAIITAEQIQGIYEDVALLQSQVAELQAQMVTMGEGVADLQPTALPANTDLNTLSVGTYYIPDVTTSATIINKPIAGTQNALILVYYGAEGELQQWYFINTKSVLLNNKIYHRYYYAGEWGDWETGYLKADDTGWLPLQLGAGVSVHNPTSFSCSYRKINNKVYVRGCVTGFVEVEKIIATLPEGFRPAQSFYTQRPTNGGKTDTLNIRTNGAIERVATTLDVLNTTNYHFIDVEFLVD